MKRLILALLCSIAIPAASAEALFTEIAYRGDDGGPVPTATQYRNPVVAGFYPDPSAIRVGDDFYLVNSTFGYFPGLPVFHSRDLVHWTQIGNAIDRPGQIDYGHNELSRGLFAASISHHDGTFYIVNTCFYCDRGNFVITAKNPAGPWSDPHWLKFEGIDPSLFFDDDGRAWLVNNGIPQGKMRYDGHRAIWLQQFDVATMSLVGPRTVLVDSGADPSTNPEHVEGPHLFRRNGWYYLTAAEGGTGEQHAQMVWRSRAVTGPYEPFPGNPVLTQRDLDPSRPDPITSAGHAQFVELKDGSWWAVFLATRPYRGNQYNLGRETFLLPMQWHDDWPVVLPRGERIPAVATRPNLPAGKAAQPTTGPFGWTERFTGSALPLPWMTINVPRQRWYGTGKQGLRITPSATPLGEYASGQPAYIGHRLQHHKATIDATLDPRQLSAGEQAGLALLQNETHFYAAMRVDDAEGPAVVLYRRAGKEQPQAGVPVARIALADAKQALRLRFQLDGPRLDAFYASGRGDWQPLARDLDASLLSTDTAGGFIGVTFGPYAYDARKQ
ncbi:MAG: glycoside hydrolase family 43 protein [Gammaproteobacteria bacterium]|uniref:Xylosidase/arabinosidase n=1 Tax=Xanthomonas boreopolis TaxID=86183 RepID=A0A919F7Z2_9XANT|nr:glycoside hydrolase family 43 protein [Pseudomonas sp. Hp2]GHH53900.1 xylosidase/arabinosidase [[Pseudomonas] boreopolis]